MRLTPGDITAALYDASMVFGVRWTALFDEDAHVMDSAGPESAEVMAGTAADDWLSEGLAMLDSIPAPSGLIWHHPRDPGRCDVWLERIGVGWVLGVAFTLQLTSLGAIRLRTSPIKTRLERLLLAE